jgi:hypothetical protein
MNQYYVIRVSDDKWVSAILNAGFVETTSRQEALRFEDANVALSILTMIKSRDAYVEEIRISVEKIER